MFAVVRFTVYLAFLIGFICGQSDEESHERNILFNKADYQAEKAEAQEKIYLTAHKICPNHTKEIEEKLDEFKECSSNIDEDQNTMCQVIEKTLKTCIKPLVVFYEKCLPKSSKGLPTYLAEAGLHLWEFVCNSNGAHLLELGNPCILKNDHAESRKCIRKLKKEATKYHYENLPEKQQICLFLQDFKSCFDTHVDNFCKDHITRESYKGLYNALLCSK